MSLDVQGVEESQGQIAKEHSAPEDGKPDEAQKVLTDAPSQSDSRAIESVVETRPSESTENADLVAPKGANADLVANDGLERKPTFRILDALSATGLRALRYAKEIPMASTITANDLSSAATASIKLNVQHNDVGDVVKPITGDARAHMYNAAHSTAHTDHRLYQVIDLDPYGTAAPFLDAAVQALADGGMLCITW